MITRGTAHRARQFPLAAAAAAAAAAAVTGVIVVVVVVVVAKRQLSDFYSIRARNSIVFTDY